MARRNAMARQKAAKYAAAFTQREEKLQRLATEFFDPESRANFRSRGDKINIYVIRGTRQQRELLKHAAEKENISMQKLIWDHLIRELEEKYGADLPLNNL